MDRRYNPSKKNNKCLNKPDLRVGLFDIDARDNL